MRLGQQRPASKLPIRTYWDQTNGTENVRLFRGSTLLRASAEMAIRLEKAGWSNADHWLRLQAAYDLAQARKHQDEIKVRRYEHELPA